MGGGRRNGRGQRGRDIRYDLSLEFEEAVFGKQTEIQFRRAEKFASNWPRQRGAPRPRPETCKQIAGRGQVRLPAGIFSIARTCRYVTAPVR